MNSGISNGKTAWILLGILALLGVMSVLGGRAYFQAHERDFAAHVREELTVVADLKAGEISQWFRERKADAETVLGNPMALAQARRVLTSQADDPGREDLLAWMGVVQQQYDYQVFALFDSNAVPRLAAPPDRTPQAGHFANSCRQALQTNAVLFTDLHRGDSNEGPHLAFWIPVPAARPVDAPAAGAFLLVVDPERYLYPLVQSWPTPSHTAETLLLRREGDDVVFLNELRHRRNTALSLRFPVSAEALPAAMAARGQAGLVEGVDYRGVPVLAAVRAVPGTPWFMVAKVDREEIFAPLRQRAWTTNLFAVVLILAAGLGVAMAWKQKNLRVIRQQLAVERANKALAERIVYLSQHANDIILLLDQDWRILEANDRAIRTYGYALEELRRMTLRELRAAELRAGFDEQVRQLDFHNGMIWETIHRRKDGSTFPVESSGRAIELEGRKYCQFILRDITERKRAEAEIRRLNRLYAVLSQVNQTVVRVEARDELFPKICQIAVEFGGFKMAWLGWLDARTKAVNPVASAGDAEGYLSQLRVYVDDRPEGRGLTGTAVREDKPCVSNDYLQDTRLQPWHALAAAKGFQAAAAFPLRFCGETCGALMFYVDERDFFRAEEIKLLEEVAMDISFALDKLDKEARRRQMETSLAIQVRIATVFSTVPDDGMFNEVIKVILDEMRSPFGVFGYLDEAGALVVPTMTRQVWDKCQVPEKTVRFPRETWGDSSWPTAIRERRTICSNEPSRHIPDGHVGIQRHISLPILFHGEAIGLFQVANKEADYTEKDVLTLADIAAHVAPLLNARLQRERAEAALVVANERLQNTLNSIAQGYYALDRDWRVLAVNATAEQHFGKLAAELIGGTFEQATQGRIPDNVREGIRQVMASGQPQQLEVKSEVRPGTWAVDYIYPRDGGVEVYFTDITERKRAELKLEEQIRELQRWHDATLGREGRILELKQQVNELLQQAGQPIRYPSATPSAPVEQAGGIEEALTGLRPAGAGGGEPPETMPPP